MKLIHTESQKPHNSGSVSTGILFITVAYDITFSVVPLINTANIHTSLYLYSSKCSQVPTHFPLFPQLNASFKIKLRLALSYKKCWLFCNDIYFFTHIIWTYEIYVRLIKLHAMNVQLHALLTWTKIRSWLGIFSRQSNFGIYWMRCLVTSTAGLDPVRKRKCLYLPEPGLQVPRQLPLPYNYWAIQALMKAVNMNHSCLYTHNASYSCHLQVSEWNVITWRTFQCLSECTDCRLGSCHCPRTYREILLLQGVY